MNKLIFILLLFVNNVYASCPGLALTNLPASVDLNTNITPQIYFRVTRQDLNSECDYVIGFDRGSAPNYSRKLYYNSNALDFILSKDVNLNPSLKDILDASNPSEHLKGKFKSSDNPIKLYFDHIFFAGLTLNPNILAGVYQDTFQVKLYEDNNGVYTLVETRPIVFYYNMPSQVSLSIVNTNAAFDPLDTSQYVDFGTLTQGESQSFDVLVQTSNGYILEVSSTNNGHLQHNSATQVINYIFRANGQTYNLNGSSNAPVTISSGIGQHTNDGFRIPVQIEVGSVANKLSGTYSDTLTITVTSNL